MKDRGRSIVNRTQGFITSIVDFLLLRGVCVRLAQVSFVVEEGVGVIKKEARAECRLKGEGHSKCSLVLRLVLVHL